MLSSCCMYQQSETKRVMKVVNDYLKSQLTPIKLTKMAEYIEVHLENSKFKDLLSSDNLPEKVSKRILILESLFKIIDNHSEIAGHIGKMTHERFEFCKILLEEAINKYMSMDEFYTDIILQRFSKYITLACDYNYYDKISNLDVYKLLMDVAIKVNEYHKNNGDTTYLLGMKVEISICQSLLYEIIIVQSLLKHELNMNVNDIIPYTINIIFDDEGFQFFKTTLKNVVKMKFEVNDEYAELIFDRLTKLEKPLKLRNIIRHY